MKKPRDREKLYYTRSPLDQLRADMLTQNYPYSICLEYSDEHDLVAMTQNSRSIVFLDYEIMRDIAREMLATADRWERSELLKEQPDAGSNQAATDHKQPDPDF